MYHRAHRNQNYQNVPILLVQLESLSLYSNDQLALDYHLFKSKGFEYLSSTNTSI